MNSEKAFLGNRPELKNILQNHGKKTVSEYISFVNQSVSDIDFSYFEPRMEEFFEVYRDTLSPIFEQSVINHSIETLKKNRLVSTADHQGVINHPFFISSTYVRTIHAQKMGYPSVVTFPCASISLSNSSFPRGISLHDVHGEEKKLYFKSLIHKLNPVFTEEPIDRETVQKMYDTLTSIELVPKSRKKILSVFKDIFFSEKFLHLKNFDDQCTYGSFLLWKHIADFQDVDLIYVSQEKIVIDLLVQKHVHQESLVHSLIFDEHFQELFVKYFDGIQGAFDTKEKTGTHLFWGVRDCKRVSLFIEENTLVDEYKEVFVSLDPDSLKEALITRRIMPAMPLCFIVLSFYYGFVCGGGFSQVNYLKKMKEAWIQILLETGNYDEEKAIIPIFTDVFLGDYATVQSFTGKPKTLLSSLDLLLEEGKHNSVFSRKNLNDDFIDAFSTFRIY